MKRDSLHVTGMKNQQDADFVRQAIESVWGVTEANINLTNQLATFSYDEKAASYIDFVQAVKDSGYSIDEKRDSQ